MTKKQIAPKGPIIAKTSLGFAMAAVGIWLANQKFDIPVYEQFTAGRSLFIAGITIVVYVVAKGLLFGAINLVRSIRGKDPIKGGDV